MHTMLMIVCAAWLGGLVTGTEEFGVVVDRLKNTANVPQTRKGSKERKSNFYVSGPDDVNDIKNIS